MNSRFGFKTWAGAKRAANIVGRELADQTAEMQRKLASARPAKKAAARKADWDARRAVVLPFLGQLRTMMGKRGAK